MSELESSEEWHTDPEDTSGDDDMDFELATESSTSGYGEVEIEEEDDEEEEGEGTTLYFDANDGTFRDEDGDLVRFAVDGEEGNEEEQEGVEEDGEEGARTPREAEAGEGAAAETTTTAAAPDAERQRTIMITQQHLLQLLRSAGLRGLLGETGTTTRGARRAALEEEDEDEDEEDENFGYNRAYRRRRAHRTVDGDRYPKIPSEEGQKLMASGTFGANDRCNHTACGTPFTEDTMRKRRKLARRMFDREMGVGSRGRARALNSLTAQEMIPGSKADMIINMDQRCYSGQFSEDGSFFFACGQDFKVRMYDTSNPYDWKYYKTVHFYGGQWTITDATLSPDNQWLAYSSIRSQVCLASTNPSDDSEPQHLDFSDMGSGGTGRSGWGRSRGHFGIWSLRFSGDGSEIVAGTSDQSVYVYDLETRRSILRIPGHTDDVNAVCFGDKMSPHILYSGSDDTTLKVWDRRSLSSYRPAGMFLGHTEGLTYIDSKGDGRYVISNAKDQTCKLWDLRKMVSTDVGERINPQDYTTNFDYRFSPYDVEEHQPHPHDCSLVTFRGHKVLNTLIRCHFSPALSTDQRYIYSGSHDGKIYVWNLDGTQKSTIDVLAATKNTRPVSDERHTDRYGYARSGAWQTIVRDCSWHPSAPIIAATSWNGPDTGLGTCTVHTWTEGVEADECGEGQGAPDLESGAAWSKHKNLGSTPMGARVTGRLAHDERFYGLAREGAQGGRRSARTRRQMLAELGGLFGDE